MVELNEQTDDRCFGCGDFHDLCQGKNADGNDCAGILQSHAFGLHGLCDILVCQDASLDGLDPFKLRLGR